MLVMKFGGTSVEDANAIRRLSDLVRGRMRHQPVVVVSAFSKVTDQLIRLGDLALKGAFDVVAPQLEALQKRHESTAADLLGDDHSQVAVRIKQYMTELEQLLRGVSAVRELSPRTTDYLLSFGELMSSQVVAAALLKRGLPTEWVDSRECIVTDDQHTQAVPNYAETNDRLRTKVNPLVIDGRVPVSGGFIASTMKGVTTTLGRGGSDFSAAIVGAGLNAARIEIWTDVDGIMSTDPNICPDARTLHSVTFDEAAELAHFGAKVLHPATLVPAMQGNIPVYVLNSRNSKSKGTKITARAPRSRPLFTAIAAKRGMSIVTVSAARSLMAHRFLNAVFEVLNRHRCSAEIVSVSEFTVSFTATSKLISEVLMEDLKNLGDVMVEEKQAIVCLVGQQIRGKVGIAAKVFNTVAAGEINVRMISQGASEINITIVIAEEQANDAVRLLHGVFAEERLDPEESKSGEDSMAEMTAETKE